MLVTVARVATWSSSRVIDIHIHGLMPLVVQVLACSEWIFTPVGFPTNTQLDFSFKVLLECSDLYGFLEGFGILPKELNLQEVVRQAIQKYLEQLAFYCPVDLQVIVREYLFSPSQ